MLEVWDRGTVRAAVYVILPLEEGCRKAILGLWERKTALPQERGTLQAAVYVILALEEGCRKARLGLWERKTAL